MRISDWSADVCSSDLAMYNETQPGGYLYENEFKREGLHVLFAVITSPYEVMTARKPITGLDAMKGLKLKTAGGAAADTARTLGAVPVQITSADVYTALQRGTVDGRFGVYEFMPAVNSVDLLQYGTIGAQVAAFATTAAMSTKLWNKLPPDTQNVLKEAGRKTVKHFCTSAQKNESVVRKMLVAKHGWSVHRLSDEERRKWSEALLRSEEHTSELQSLMRISYAVFCLKKKKKKQNRAHHVSVAHYNTADTTTQ